MPTKLITNTELYHKVIEQVPKAKHFVWIGTADIKDLHVLIGSRSVSFLHILDQLVKKEVEVKLLHAKEPGKNFRESFDKYPALWKKMERRMCPRVHFKHLIIDGKFAYTGSANLTGAGLGMKSNNRRNFEMGIISTESEFIDAIMKQFIEVWEGNYCSTCGRKTYCPDRIK